MSFQESFSAIATCMMNVAFQQRFHNSILTL